MVYAIEMFFDKDTEKKIMEFYYKLKEENSSSYLLDIDSLPHVTMGCFNDIDVEECNNRLEGFCNKTPSFSLTFPSVGAFSKPQPVLFLSPVVTQELLNIHKDLWSLFSDCNYFSHEFYVPGYWIPHCTVDISGDIDVICKSTELLLLNFSPIKGQITNMQWVEITNPVKRLQTCMLK